VSASRNTTLRDKHRTAVSKDHPPCHWCVQRGVTDGSEHIDYQAHHLDPLAFQIDHVTPLSRGGSDTLDNCVPSHRACNRDKSDKLNYQPGVTFVTERCWWN